MTTRHTNAKPTEERRDCEVRHSSSAVGRSTGSIVCPFCATLVEVYLWSLAGSGKRCECGALLTWGAAYKQREVEVT